MAKEEKNNQGLVGVILGICALASILYTPYSAFILSITGLVFALKQRKNFKNSWSTAGIWLNLIAIILTIALVIVVAILIQNNPSALSGITG